MHVGVPAFVANTTRAKDIKRGGSDKIDAQMLATLLRIGLTIEVYVPTKEVQSSKDAVAGGGAGIHRRRSRSL